MRAARVVPVGENFAVQRLVPIKMMVLGRAQHIEKQVQILGALNGAVFERRRTGPPDHLALAARVLDHGRCSGAVVLDAVQRPAGFPRCFRFHPHFAGAGQRIEPLRGELARRGESSKASHCHPEPALPPIQPVSSTRPPRATMSFPTALKSSGEVGLGSAKITTVCASLRSANSLSGCSQRSTS